MEWNFIFYNLGVYGYWLNLNLISIHRFQVPKVFWTWNLWILNESIFSQYPMILVNFCNSQQTQQILSTAEHWVNFKNLFWQLLLYNISYIMHSFSAMTKVEKKKNKNTSPRTAPAMSCSRLKINVKHSTKDWFLTISIWKMKLFRIEL